MCLSTREGSAPSVRRPVQPAAGAALALLALCAAKVTAAAPCKVAILGQLPVTMEGMRPLVHAGVNGTDALFIADSGAFYSFLSPAAAAQLNLHLAPAPFDTLTGVGGQFRVSLATVKTFTLFKYDFHNVDFLVGGNELRNGVMGLLGQNVFRNGDVEYDLANGMIRILRTHGDCRKAMLAYWAYSKNLPYSQIEITYATPQQPHTIAHAEVNGSKISVLFDSGASISILTLSAARQAGVTPDSPGVKPGGNTFGLGSAAIRSWIAPFASFKIGDEEIRNTHLRIGDERGSDWDMLIGADFFLSHRIYVANDQHKLYFTYNGGPVFNLTTTPMPTPGSDQAAAAGGAEPAAPAAAPAETAAQAAADEPPDAAAYARHGTASASRRDYAHAIADLTRAIELSPTEASYFYERGMARWSNKEGDKALEDFGEAIKLEPDDVRTLVARAQLRAARHESAETIRPDLDAADRAAPKEADVRLTLGHLYEYLHDYPAAIAQYDRWIDARRRSDAQIPSGLNARCWARALANQQLDQALSDCNAAVRAQPKAAAFHDSRGLVYLRQGKYDKAIADYDAAIALNPKVAWSLYGRGLARQHLGQTAAGQADIAAATAIWPRIAEEAARDGIGP